VFIQTDKPLYKPGDKVKFRVLLIDSEMKAFKVAKMKVELIDPFDNVVGEYEEDEEGKLELGVIKHEFEIATEPVHGLWGLRVTTSEEDDEENAVVTDQKFEIKEYVLPRFEVLIENNHDVTQNEGVVRLTISGQYTFGEFVKGKAKITARVFDMKYPELVQHTTTKTVDIELKKLVEFNIINELKIVNEVRPYLVKFEVEFEEGLTTQKMTKTVEVRVHKTGEYSLELVPVEKRFKPGFPYKLKAIVRKFDGTLATDKFTPVKLKIDYHYKPSLCSVLDRNSRKTYEFNVEKNLKNGIADFDLNVAENTTAMAISASYQDVKRQLNVPRHEARSREYLVIKSATSR
jgi:CD109 antigen